MQTVKMNNKGKQKQVAYKRGPYKQKEKQVNTQTIQDIQEYSSFPELVQKGNYSRYNPNNLPEESIEQLIRLRNHLQKFQDETVEKFERTYYRIKILLFIFDPLKNSPFLCCLDSLLLL